MAGARLPGIERINAPHLAIEILATRGIGPGLGFQRQRIVDRIFLDGHGYKTCWEPWRPDHRPIVPRLGVSTTVSTNELMETYLARKCAIMAPSV